MDMTRDHFISLLDKTAADGGGSSGVQAGLEASRSESRSVLKGLFDQAEATQEKDSREIGKLFPEQSGVEHFSTAPLLKTAAAVAYLPEERRSVYFSCLEELSRLG